ncbi:hypothetical protein PMAYCL1PPCAC_25328, partial [Pristionchus mayeri]
IPHANNILRFQYLSLWNGHDNIKSQAIIDWETSTRRTTYKFGQEWLDWKSSSCSHREQLEDGLQIGLLQTAQQLLRRLVAIDNLRPYSSRSDGQSGCLCGLSPCLLCAARLEDSEGTERRRGLLLRFLLFFLALFRLLIRLLLLLCFALPLPHSLLLSLLLVLLHQSEDVRGRDVHSHHRFHFLHIVGHRQRGVRVADECPRPGCSDPRLQQSLLHLHHQRDVLLN